MNLIDLLNKARKLPLDERYALLISHKRHYRPRSIDMKYLLHEISRVQFRRLRRDVRKAA